MLKFTLANLRAHKLRLLLTGLAIMIGVSFVAGSYMFTDTLGSTFTDLYKNINKGIDISIQAKRVGDQSFSNDRQPIPQDVLKTVQDTQGVERAVGFVLGNALMIGPDGKAIQNTQGAPSLGTNWVDDPDLNSFKLSQGQSPKQPNEIVMDVGAFEKAKLKIGDTITVQFADATGEYKVVGTATFGDAKTPAGATMALFYAPIAQKVLGYPDQYTSIAATVEDGANLQATLTRLNERLPSEFEAISGKTQAEQNAREIKKQLGFINTFLLVFSGITVFVSAFIIANTFSILIAQRTKDLALLRAIGASRKQVAWSLLLEALIVGVLASIIGIAVGAGIATGIRGLIKAIGGELPPSSLQFEPRTAIVAFSVGMVVTVVSTLLPIRRATRIPPVAAMRESTVEAPVQSGRRSAIGIVGFAIGATLVWWGLFGDPPAKLIVLACGGALAFVAVSLLTPLVVTPITGIARVIGRIPFALLGLLSKRIRRWSDRRKFMGELGRSNTRRNPRRTAITSSALMIGVALVAAVSTLTESGKASIRKVLSENVSADYIFMNEQFSLFSHELATEAAALPGVQDAYGANFGTWKEGEKSRNLLGLDPNAFRTVISADTTEAGLDGLAKGGLLVDAQKSQDDPNYAVGKTVHMTFVKGSLDVKIVGTLDNTKMPLPGDFVVSRSLYAQMNPDVSDVMVLVNVKPGQEKAAKKQLEALAKQFPTVTLNDQAEYSKQQEQQLNSFLALLSALLFLAIFIAVLGIINTLALSVIERTREMGLLRAVGARRKQIRQMIRTESVMIAIVGSALGSIVGILFGALVVRSLKSEGITELVIPFSSIISIIILSAIVGVFAAILPARRAARTNILEAIAS